MRSTNKIYLIALAATMFSVASSALADDAHFRFYNRCGYKITSVYITSVEDPKWGRDILGDDVLPDGRETIISGDVVRGSYDVRVKFSDGQTRDFRNNGFDLCNVSSMWVTSDDAYGRNMTLHWALYDSGEE